MKNDLKICPFLKKIDDADQKQELLEEYYSQRTSFHLESNENLQKVGISDNKVLQQSEIIPKLLQYSTAISDLLVSASRLQFFRLKLLEKIQTQQELHDKCENISLEYKTETTQKLKALQEALKRRKKLLFQIDQDKNRQRILDEEIDYLNADVQAQRRNLALLQVKDLKVNLNANENSLDRILDDIKEYKCRVQQNERVNRKENQEFEENIARKAKVRAELEEKKAKLIARVRELLQEKQTIVDDIGEKKIEVEGNTHVYRQSALSFCDEIKEIEGQIVENKALQKASISDRCSLLEPFKYLVAQNEMKRESELEREFMDLTLMVNREIKEKQEEIYSRGDKLNYLLGNFNSSEAKHEQVAIENVNRHSMSMLKQYKSLLDEAKKTEILLKTLEIKDRALDSFKHENCPGN